ncbi:cell wall metabolism sensor histidine kinase WalK [Streptomyces sp. CoH27]|uniref:sensor histidine kinase n=1 Tax=Streptomyces sp. CoH27 TaxID=2875763 RepID=UPI001CD4DDD7|nr:HAMP domain-containing sensor histidine kinase [Streptomyces sp. CoH27]
MTARLARRLRLGTVRSRVTIVAGLALTAAVTLGIVVMYLLQVDSARRTVDSQLHTYATQIEQSASAGGTFPNPLPASSLDASAEAQVLADDGSVLAATRTLTGLPAVYSLPPGSDTPVRQKAADGVVAGEVATYGEHLTVGGRPVSIVTTSPTTTRSQINETFARLLLIGLPALLVLAGGTIWLVVGRALRPVEQIRRTVTDITDISATDLTRRVPEPGTDDEVGRLADTMNAMLARLDDAATRQRRFVADASHELRSPLTAIRTGLEVGLAHPEQAPWPTIAERAVRQAARLEELISELLQLARVDAGKAAARRRRVPLAELLTEVEAGTAPSGPVRIELDIPAELAVTGDAAELSRVFRNVIDNALRYARTTVRVTAREDGDTVRVTVGDDGPGIPREEQERVFDRFVRLDTGRTHGVGSTGLGLAIAKAIIVAHEGSIAIDTAPEGGALVAITLRGFGEALTLL